MVQKRDSGGPTRSIKSLEFEENIDFSIAQAIVLLDKFDQVEKEAFQKWNRSNSRKMSIF